MLMSVNLLKTVYLLDSGKILINFQKVEFKSAVKMSSLVKLTFYR